MLSRRLVLNTNHHSRGRAQPALMSAALLVAMLAALIWVAPARAQGALPGSYAAAACPFDAIAGLTIDCGYLTAAESRSPVSSRTIQLAVAILRSSNPNKAADPVLFLSGGPGQPALPIIALAAAAYAPVLAQRDMIFIDQRGTGYSKPALNCPLGADLNGGFPLGAQSNERPELVQAAVDAYIACGQQYRAAGIDLSAYNSVESAADLEDLRRALGYAQWNLFGASYGTRLALTAMQYRPETIRSAVLDSVYPLEANLHTGTFASYNQSLTRLFAACAATADCNAAYPQLDHTFEQLIPQLNAEPIQVPLLNLETNEVIDYLPVTGVDMSILVFQLLYGTPAIPLLPRLIADTARGDSRILSVLLSAFVSERTQTSVPIISPSMQIAVQCNEDATFASARDFVAARDSNRRASALAFSPLFNEAVLDICAAWGLHATNQAENRPVRSDVPALIISGEFDPITPSQNASSTAKNLSNSFVINYPHGGHTPSASSPCVSGAIAAFLANPTQRPDTACIASEAPLPFLVPR